MPNGSLTTELEGFTEGCVRSGRYGNVSEVDAALPLHTSSMKRAASLRR